MHEEAVDGLERDLREVLVRAMDRVPGLKPDDPLPSALGEDPPRLGGIPRELRELRLRALEHGDAPGEVERLLLVQPSNARMRVVGRAEALLRLALLVVLECLIDLEHGDGPAGLVGESDAVARGRRVDGEAHGERPRQARSRGASRRRPARSRRCP